MDADFEQHYQAAERAYGLGDYTEAYALASALWDQLQGASDQHDPSLALGWRAVVSLLLGHIQLHGLEQPEKAAISYERVLEGDVDATIAALAEQGLDRCRSEHTPTTARQTPAGDGTIPELLKDPFLSTDADQAKAARADVVTAMPWLSGDEEPQAIPTPDPTPSPGPTVTPEANSIVEIANQEPELTTEEQPLNTIEPPLQPQEPGATKLEEEPQAIPTPDPTPSPGPTVTPEANSIIEIANQEPELTTEEQPLNTIELPPQPQEPASTKLLENSWLRVQLQPETKSPTDSVEPMGLINRIKGVFARSAGR